MCENRSGVWGLDLFTCMTCESFAFAGFRLLSNGGLTFKRDHVNLNGLKTSQPWSQLEFDSQIRSDLASCTLGQSAVSTHRSRHQRTRPSDPEVSEV